MILLSFQIFPLCDAQMRPFFYVPAGTMQPKSTFKAAGFGFRALF
jgi:hypothetical protein